MISTLSPTDFAVLYRFSVTLAGVNEEAEHLVHEVLEEKLPRLADSEPQKSIVQLLSAIWENRPQPVGDAPISNLPPQFQWMKTRERAVATLRDIGRFSEEEIATICGSCELGEPKTPEKMVSILDSIVVSPELLKRFAVTVQGINPPFRLFSALGISLLFAGLVTLTVAGWVWRDWHARADETLAQKFVDFVGETPREKPESVDVPIGELADVLFLKYGLENYPIPAGFAKFPASQISVNQVDGHPVVQIGLKDSHAQLMLFRAEDFGLGADDDWQTASLDGWSLALRSQNQQGQVLLLQGTGDELRAILPK